MFSTAAALYGQSYIGSQTFQPGFSSASVVNVSGALSLSAGNYTAASWLVIGNLVLTTPGNYTVTGRMSLVGRIVGPATGTATIRFVDSMNQVGASATVVSVIQGPVSDPTTTPPPATPDNPLPTAPLMNISTRATLAAGQVLTPGFVVGRPERRRVLIRAIGPGLAAFGVAGSAAACSLTVFDATGTQIAANAGWGANAELALLSARVGAFALVPNSADAAVLLTLAPGSYTARVTGVGEVLLEIYFVDNPFAGT